MTPMSALPARAMLALGFAATTLLAAGGAVASGSEHARSAPADARYAAECGSCHIAYPPRLLPPDSWRQVMSTLDQHFGSDASPLDPVLARHIGAFLERNAGAPERLGASATPRITKTRWFVRKHDEVPAAVWRRASVASAANCAACHTGAESGDFRERNIRIPR